MSKQRTKKVPKVDIFHLFRRMNDEDYQWVLDLTDTELKSVSAYVLMCWIHGVDRNQSAHFILTDLYVNTYAFNMPNHSRLLLLLLFVANSGMGSPRYTFRKSVSRRDSLAISAISNFYECTGSDALGYMDILSTDEIDEMIEIYNETTK